MSKRSNKLALVLVIVLGWVAELQLNSIFTRANSTYRISGIVLLDYQGCSGCFFVLENLSLGFLVGVLDEWACSRLLFLFLINGP